jgi:uncharacterized protein (TIGR00369 family)
VSLPDDARSHATLELKVNLLRSVREGSIRCEAQLIHAGRSTQVWDATVTDERTGKTVAVFRCTQLVLRD